MEQKEKVIRLSKRLMENLEALLNTGDWNESSTLKDSHRRIGNIRDEIQELTKKLSTDEEKSINNEKNLIDNKGEFLDFEDTLS